MNHNVTPDSDMTDKITLRALFDSNKSELEQKLEGLSLPKDNQKIQQIISEHLTSLFDSEGEFRQSLTQAEDYLLQATMSLLSAQQEMGSAFVNQELRLEPKQCSNGDDLEEGVDKKQSRIDDFFNKPVKATNTLIGTGAGALIGKVALGGWGAVFGAIAGTAVVIYLAGKNKNQVSQSPRTAPLINQEIINEPIDIPSFIGIVGNICDSVDNLMSTFRSQINRVIDKYESREKPTIEKEYRFLLESIQTLVGYKRTHDEGEDKYIKKLQIRIEDLSECLENYNLSLEDYTGENDSFFDIISSPETKEKKMVYPAIVKEGVVMIKGKVFIPVGD